MTQSQIFKRVPISTRSRSSIDQPDQLHRSVPPTTAHPTTTKLDPTSQPKRRGRWKWLDIFTPFYLPRYDGTYNVGTLTLELPIPDSIPSQVNNPLRLKENPNAPAFELTTSLLTLYYPSHATKPVSSGPTWITLSQIKGYFKFAGLDLLKRIVALPIALFATARIKLPTLGSVPIAQSPSKRNLVLFCHGLTGNRTCYSQYCGQLAARGYVVAAIEHRDRSGAHTVVNSSSRPTQIKYVDMDDFTDETRSENYFIARAYQLEFRIHELLAASELLSGFAKPAGWKSIKSSNLRIKGSAGYTGDDGMRWDDQEWDRFASMVQWDTDVTLAGHSFGSATMFAASRYPKSPQYWSKLILLDPWLETIEYWPKSAPPLETADFVELPILVINSPGFTVWSSHFRPLYDFLSTRDPRHSTWFFTIGGIIHSSFSDLPIIFERLWRMKGQLKVDSQTALDIMVRASIEFMSNTTGEVLAHQPITKGADGVCEAPGGSVIIHVQPKS